MKWQCLLEKNMLNRWRNRSGHRCSSTRACQFQWHPVEELAPWRLRKFLGETMNCGKITGISWEIQYCRFIIYNGYIMIINDDYKVSQLFTMIIHQPEYDSSTTINDVLIYIFDLHLHSLLIQNHQPSRWVCVTYGTPNLMLRKDQFPR